MTNLNKISILLIGLALHLAGCKSMMGVGTATALGTTGGETFGEIIGNAAGNAEEGAVIGSRIGEVTGTVIGITMDKQVGTIKKELPQAKVERVGEVIIVSYNSTILFRRNHFRLMPSAEKNLDEMVAVLKKYPDVCPKIHGPAENNHSGAPDKLLSEKRAASIGNYLQTKGIDRARFR